MMKRDPSTPDYASADVVFLKRKKPKRDPSLPALEKKIETDIRVALAEAGILCFKHNVDNRQMSTGLGLGTSDLICIVPPLGRFLGIEVKRPGKKPSEHQFKWLAVVRKFGGMSGVATSVAEALALVEAARQAVTLDASECAECSGVDAEPPYDGRSF
jgi:hypothetical protein